MAAGALFIDDARRVLLVRPTYKNHWDIPGGYVEPGESPRSACIREINEELSLAIDLGPLLVLDWAPADDVGDKLLAVFDGGSLADDQLASIKLPPDELAEWRYVEQDQLDALVPERLRLRLQVAVQAKANGETTYAERGVKV